MILSDFLKFMLLIYIWILFGQIVRISIGNDHRYYQQSHIKMLHAKINNYTLPNWFSINSWSWGTCRYIHAIHLYMNFLMESAITLDDWIHYVQHQTVFYQSNNVTIYQNSWLTINTRSIYKYLNTKDKTQTGKTMDCSPQGMLLKNMKKIRLPNHVII